MNRWPDSWQQGPRDVAHAEHALEDGDYAWAAFVAQQAGGEGARGGHPVWCR